DRLTEPRHEPVQILRLARVPPLIDHEFDAVEPRPRGEIEASLDAVRPQGAGGEEEAHRMLPWQSVTYPTTDGSPLIECIRCRQVRGYENVENPRLFTNRQRIWDREDSGVNALVCPDTIPLKERAMEK